MAKGGEDLFSDAAARAAGEGARRGPRETARGVRTEIARELHDRVAQDLSVLLLEVQAAKRLSRDRAVLEQLALIEDKGRQSLIALREIVDDARGGETSARFVSLLQHLICTFEGATHTRVSLVVESDWPERLQGHAAMTVYRVIEEALNNVRHHSAAGVVIVRLHGGASCARVNVEDDGRGLPWADSHPGLGLIGMRERARLLGGDVRITSYAGGGTVLEAWFDLDGMQPKRAAP
jgi:signal transduction histidine kinase